MPLSWMCLGMQNIGSRKTGAGKCTLPCQPLAKVEAESKHSFVLMAKAISAATVFPLMGSALSFLLLVKLLWLICTPLFSSYILAAS